MTLEVHEFIRRFLLHVLPAGYMRIRYFGFFANCHRTGKLQLCRQLLSVSVNEPDTSPREKPHWTVLLQSLTGVDPLLCPHCHKGRLVQLDTFPPVIHLPNLPLRGG